MNRTLQEYIRMYPCGCSLCMEEATGVGPIGMHWCEKHRDRLLLMKYGAQNRYASVYDETRCLLMGGVENYMHACHMFKEPRIQQIVEQIREFVVMPDVA